MAQTHIWHADFNLQEWHADFLLREDLKKNSKMNDIDHLSVRPPYPMEKALGFDNPLPYLNSDKWKFHNSGIFYTFPKLNPL